MAEKLNELEIQTATCQSKQEELTTARREFENRQRELDTREAGLYKQMEQLTTSRFRCSQRVENTSPQRIAELNKRQDELRGLGTQIE